MRSHLAVSDFDDLISEKFDVKKLSYSSLCGSLFVTLGKDFDGQEVLRLPRGVSLLPGSCNAMEDWTTDGNS